MDAYSDEAAAPLSRRFGRAVQGTETVDGRRACGAWGREMWPAGGRMYDGVFGCSIPLTNAKSGKVSYWYSYSDDDGRG